VYQEEAMNVQQYPSPACWLSTLIVLVLLGAVPAVLAQAAETEPNDTCLTANAFGEVGLPFTVDGELEAASDPPSDVDFYRFQAEPGATLEVTLQGQSSGNGTLGDPYLGFFDDGCMLVAANDDHMNLDSRLIILVPDSGDFVLAATGCCDSGFTGEHSYNGTYLLTLSSFAAINSIFGQVVDADTQEPLEASVELYACEDQDDPETCYHSVASTYTYDGTFSFTTDYGGSPLAVGSYLVRAYVFGFEGQTGVFTVGEGDSYDVDNIEIAVPPNIGSIIGRVVDAGTGAGLSGVDYPYTWVELQQCQQDEEGSVWCYSISGASADGTGNFSFVPGYPGQMPAGDYKVLVYAQDYVTGEGTGIPAVEADEHRDVGDIRLEPHPIRLSVVTPCENLPTTGGFCRFSVRVTNRARTQINGATWSLVSSESTGSLAGSTQFQTAHPIYLVLSPGMSHVVRFHFYVPATVPDGAWICARTLFGENPIQPFFNTLVETGFCIEKGMNGFSSVPKKEVHKILREQKRPQEGFLHPRHK
jgi:hypothetical protein